MTRHAFFVDGHMEQLILQRTCPGAVVRRLEVNGDDVAISAIVTRVCSLYRTLGNRCYPVYILVDREGRDASFDEIAAEILSLIADAGLDPSQFRVGVCDRMIENWILADFELISERFGISITECPDGDNGKSRLRVLCGRQLIYKETTVGVDLFCSINPNRARVNSMSLDHFLNQIERCDWLIHS